MITATDSGGSWAWCDPAAPPDLAPTWCAARRSWHRKRARPTRCAFGGRSKSCRVGAGEIGYLTGSQSYDLTLARDRASACGLDVLLSTDLRSSRRYAMRSPTRRTTAPSAVASSLVSDLSRWAAGGAEKRSRPHSRQPRLPERVPTPAAKFPRSAPPGGTSTHLFAASE